MKKDRYVVVIRKFMGWSAYEIPCFIGQRTYKWKWYAYLVYKYWTWWTYRHAGDKEPIREDNVYPISTMFGVIHPDGSWEITER